MGGRGDGTYNPRVRKDTDKGEDKEPTEYDDYRDHIQQSIPNPTYWSQEARQAWKASHPDWIEPTPEMTPWTDQDYNAWEHQHPGWFEETGLENPNPSTRFPVLHPSTQEQQDDDAALEDAYSTLPLNASMDEAFGITRDWLDQHTVNVSAGDLIPTDFDPFDFKTTTIKGITIHYEKPDDNAYLDSVLRDLHDAIQLLILIKLPPITQAALDSVVIAQGEADSVETNVDAQIVIKKPRHANRVNAALDYSAFTRATGYALAQRKYGSITPPTFSDYAKVLHSGEPPVSDYAYTSRANDFAEAVALYVTNPERLKLIAPERFKVITRLMIDPEYGG